MRPSKNRLIALLALAGLGGATLANADPAVLTTANRSDGSPVPKLDELEAAGAVIGSIAINNGSIFDLENPEEDNFLYRFANKTHITTRPQVIEQQLLFEPGDEFSVQRLQESERILRDNRYIQAARITAIPQDGGAVDIEVATKDTWTLLPKFSFSHSGGESKSRVGLKEGNLFGSGISLEALFESDVDRSHVGDQPATDIEGIIGARKLRPSANVDAPAAVIQHRIREERQRVVG
jgi:hypothetical protein